MKIFYMLLISTLVYSLNGQVSLNYQTPHPDILSLADVSPAPLLRIDANANNAFLLERNMYKSIEELSEVEVRLGGLRINPKSKMSSRIRYVKTLSHLNPKTGEITAIEGLPENGQFSKMAWSHDQSKVAVLNTSEKGVSLWIIDIENRSAKNIFTNKVHGSLGTTMVWLKDNKNLLIKTVADIDYNILDRDEIVPKGPTISENDGQKAQNRTYQDLLKNPTDELNFIKLATSEIWKVGIDGNSKRWLPADLYDDMELSPDGEYILVGTIKEPFSYIVPYYRFPYEYKIYNKHGDLVKEQFNIPLIEELPQGFMAVSTHPRSINWRGDKAASLYWVEALDGGDPEKKVDYRDAVYQINAPFEKAPELIVKTKERYSGITWGSEDFAILYEYWWNTRNLRTSSFNPSNGETTLINERNYQDRYNDPGSFVTVKNEYGKNIIKRDGVKLYLLGDGFSEKGKFPFVDQFDLSTKESTRLYQAKDKTKLEDFVLAINIEKGDLISRIESPNEYPNYFLRNIYTDKLTAITRFSNPFEALNSVHKEVITYKRDDGIELSATLYLPVGYDMKKKEKMPMIMWAYPREFKDKSSAGQTTNNPNEFTYPYYGSPLYWANRGYVILDDAAFPIVGEGEVEPNDSFVKQLVANAKAAIDAVDNLGYIDRNRVAVGGHSYGAFMTANLLSHSDLFAAGIARSGAYNRTLTPFGFQSEERNYWDAPNVYNEMSPFMNADKMKTPLLLIHGEADNNSGTYPMQSERYFNALKGLGATVRLVILPKESHGYVARESIMHLLWEQDTWLEKYVKNNNRNKSE